MDDTICAIATTVGESSINVIRISGADSINIVGKIFDKDISKKSSHTITYGHIINDSEVLDEVLLSVFFAPKTFTTENIVEINTHGGVLTASKILELLVKMGCRLAEPGEFLKRAFLNGRIDLTQAEAVGDLISAKSETARKLAIKGIESEIKNKINSIRKSLISILGNIEVNIDYPEYEDIEVVTTDMISSILTEVSKEVSLLLSDSEKGIIVKKGLNVAIIGKPNVGKSSLLNALINKEKAIVTDVRGTTRDIVEETITIDGILINFLDTAGIRETTDIVEKIGVSKSVEAMKEADLVIFVVDSSCSLDIEDLDILNKLNNQKVLIVYNKNDIPRKNKIELIDGFESIEVSALKKSNIDKLKEKISIMFKFDEITSGNYAYVSNVRQISLLKNCETIVKNIKSAINNNMPIDIIEIDIKELWDTLGEITGETYKEELLDEIFNKFCLGK